MPRTDIVLINPGSKRQVYQDLGKDLAASEPPYWLGVLAEHLRREGFSVAALDASAENLSPEETAERVAALDPLLTAVVVYGSQPSASTQNMTAAGAICRAVRAASGGRIAMSGLHPSALPERTLAEEDIDFAIQGEGPHTLDALLKALRTGREDYADVPGLWYRKGGSVLHSEPSPLIEDLDAVLPIAAWDLLPMDRYRAHNWHCFGDIRNRSPYAAIYTSYGCPYSCLFCCINAPFGKPGIRYRSPDSVVAEIDLLVREYGVRNFKFIDELFVLNEKHYMGIVDLLIERGYDLNIWAYARVDTVRAENLRRMRRAGITWLALGIESANPDVRDGAQKRMKVRDVKNVVQTIRDAGISIIGNFIFGLPDDTLASMQETLDMAMDLNCEFANFYCAMAYPGSKLYDVALAEGWKLPASWHGFSQHSYEMLPLPTKHLGAREVLRFRDEAFHSYFENPSYLAMIERRFGPEARAHVEGMTRTRLKRKLLES